MLNDASPSNAMLKQISSQASRDTPPICNKILGKIIKISPTEIHPSESKSYLRKKSPHCTAFLAVKQSPTTCGILLYFKMIQPSRPHLSAMAGGHSMTLNGGTIELSPSHNLKPNQNLHCKSGLYENSLLSCIYNNKNYLRPTQCTSFAIL